MSEKPDTTAAATDVGEFISDLDGGMFERVLSIALSQVAAASMDHERKGEVKVTFTFSRIPGTTQTRCDHNIKFTKPTSAGKASEEQSRATVLHVGRFGALSLSQPELPDFRQSRIDGA